MERKTLILFGICLLLLIGGAFWWVMRITEQIVADNTRSKAHELIAVNFLKRHLTDAPFVRYDKFKDFFSDTFADSVQSENSFATVVLEEHARIDLLTTIVADDPTERARLTALDADVREYISNLLDDLDQRQPIPDKAIDQENLLKDQVDAGTGKKPPFASRFGNEDEYYYYEPILFRSYCINCHASEANEKNLTPKQWQANKPVFVARISMPSVKATINRSRAILWAFAIGTVLFSMLVVYL
ncbi:hypothetical protein N9242_03175, partial [Vicingaceae bacterium]|nr:hypothetical protein [Vicingaceae bacterium]